MERDGSNAEDMVLDLLAAFEATGPKWFATYEDLEIAFHEIEKERDCPGKFEKLYYMAKELKNEAMAEHYKAKISEQASALGLRFASPVRLMALVQLKIRM